MARKKKAKTETKKTQKKETANKIDRKQFIQSLSKVKPGVASKDIIEQSDHFVFEEGKIWSYNDEISVSQGFNHPIKGSIKAQEFYNLLLKIPHDEIEIEQKKSNLYLTAENFEAMINIADTSLEADIVNPPGINSKKWNDLPENFTEAVSFCQFSASSNMIKPELTCIWITNDDEGEGVAIACDSYRGTMFYLESSVKDPFLLPASVAKHMPVYNPTKYIVDENWIHFINKEKTTFSCRVLAADYDERAWEFFNVDGEEVELPEGFDSVIKRAETIIVEEFDQDRSIDIKLTDGQIECKGQSSVLGYVKEKQEIDYSGDEVNIQVHPALLADILKHSSKLLLGERLKFETDNFEHVIVLFDPEEDEN